MKPRASKKKDRHLIPKKGDAIYIDGYWKEEHGKSDVWVKATRTRVNGIIVYVDYEDQEVRICWRDHPYADPEEDKVTSIDFAILYGQWSPKKGCYVITDKDV